MYYRLLPHLGVNRNITTPWHMLPEMYQGLGLPNFLVLSLASKVAFLQCNWDFPGSTGDSLRFNYEAFLVEVGLYGNLFSWDYNKMGGLATKGTWFQNTREMAALLGIRVELHDQYHLQPVREGDSSLMCLFYDAGFTGKQALEALNVVRRFKNVLHLSDLLLCDGKTIDWSLALS